MRGEEEGRGIEERRTGREKGGEEKIDERWRGEEYKGEGEEEKRRRGEEKEER